MIGTKIFDNFSKITRDRDTLKRGLHLAYFQMLKRRSGTRLFSKRVVWSERALFFLQISEIKFLGNCKYRERWDSELNAALLPENVTFDPRVTIPIVARKPGRKADASLFWSICWWYLSETIIARNYFQIWNLTGSKKELRGAIWHNNFVFSELKSMIVNEFQWNLRTWNLRFWRNSIFWLP